MSIHKVGGLLCWLLACAGGLQGAPATISKSAADYAALWAYNGHWQVKRSDGKVDDLLNQCALNGKYFTCQQTVNGNVSALLVMITTGKPGQFSTQSVMPDGRAGGRGDLEISGDHWVFLSHWDQGGATTFYKTTNTFSGETKIHFDQQQSTNNRDWKTVSSGDETRIKSGPKTIVP